MKFVKWIILIISFALTDSRPITEQPSDNLNFTNNLNKGLIAFLQSLKTSVNTGLYENGTKHEGTFSNIQMINGSLYNVTMITEFQSTKYELPSNYNDTFKISAQMSFAFLGNLQNPNNRFVADKIMIDLVFKVTEKNEVTLEYSNFDHAKINQLATDYQYKPNEETQIKEEIETAIKKEIANLNSTRNNSGLVFAKYRFLGGLQKLLLANNIQYRYYFISTILSTNYTLNNITIYGLWNVKTIFFNDSNMEAYPEIGMGAVIGSIVQNFSTTSQELSFKADNIYISFNPKIIKVNVKIGGYSLLNEKLNTPLADDQSKLIVEEIESAFAASLEAQLKEPKVM